MTLTHCPTCQQATHASESNDAGLCTSCMVSVEKLEADRRPIEIKAFPAGKLDLARELIAKGHRRLVAAAAKVGQAAPAAPTIVVVAERTILVCNTCRRGSGDADAWKRAPEGSLCRQWGSTPPCDPLHQGNGCAGTMQPRSVVDLEVTSGRPSLAGWDFLAVVEPLVGGNLLRQVPWAAVVDGELEPFRDGEITCDHCRKNRKRLETFIVRADGSDLAIAAGTYKQVGRNCLSAFLGGKSTAELIWSLNLEKLLREVAEDDDSGPVRGYTPTEAFDLLEFLAWTSSSIRIIGWTSKAQAVINAQNGGSGDSTASRVSYLLTPQSLGAHAKWIADRRDLQPTEADIAQAAAALAWAIALLGASDYERNLGLIARQPTLAPKHTGILASAINAYLKHTGQDLESKRKAAGVIAPSQHVGEVGKRLDLQVTIERVIDTETDYGILHIHTMRDAHGNAIVWKTTSKRLEVGRAFALRGTVKKLSEFRGELQTELSRCTMSEGEVAA